MRCKLCGSEKKVLLHHVSYEKNVTVPLCTLCHARVHANKKSPLFPVDKRPLRQRTRKPSMPKEKGEGWITYLARLIMKKYGLPEEDEEDIKNYIIDKIVEQLKKGVPLEVVRWKMIRGEPFEDQS